MGLPTPDNYTFRERRRDASLGGHVYVEKWDCPTFSGGSPEDLMDFWIEFMRVYEQAEWEEDMVYEKICCVLHGSPLRMIKGIQDQQAAVIMHILFDTYAPVGYQWEHRRRLEKARRSENESLLC